MEPQHYGHADKVCLRGSHFEPSTEPVTRLQVALDERVPLRGVADYAADLAQYLVRHCGAAQKSTRPGDDLC